MKLNSMKNIQTCDTITEQQTYVKKTFFVKKIKKPFYSNSLNKSIDVSILIEQQTYLCII